MAGVPDWTIFPPADYSTDGWEDEPAAFTVPKIGEDVQFNTRVGGLFHVTSCRWTRNFLPGSASYSESSPGSENAKQSVAALNCEARSRTATSISLSSDVR